MPAAWSPLVVAPAAALLSLAYASRPRRDPVVGPLRLAVVRAALATGAFAVLSVEILGALGALTAVATAGAWLAFLLAALGIAGWRWRRHRGSARAGRLRTRLRSRWQAYGRGEQLLVVTIGALLLAELVVALLAEPNNYDSQTYHLPKVEHWVAQGSLDFWPTAIHRQVTIPPGAEYLLLHLRLFTGGDALYNLVQWAAGIGCLLVASRIAGQLGGSRRAQLITAFVVATTPMVTLQATSTQTDLVVAAWVGCVATLVLDGLRRPATAGSVLALGTATGLTAITKTTGLIGAGPLLALWGVAQLKIALARRPVDGTAGTDGAGGGRVRAVLRVAGSAAAVLAVAAVITGPFLVRVDTEFGNPLGPPRLRDSIPMQRHDPAAVLVNLLRIGHTAFDTPLGPLRDSSAAAIERFATLVGVEPNDRAITFGQSRFPVRSWYPDEDRVAFPLAGGLALIGAALALARPRTIAGAGTSAAAGTAAMAEGRLGVGVVRAYAGAVGVAVLLHAAMIKWQPWENRLLLYAVVLAAPLAGLWLDALFRRRAGAGRRSVATVAAVAVLATSALSGTLAISYGFPRRLVGAGSVLTTSDWGIRFLRRPQWAPEYRWAADRVDAAGARRIGLVQRNDDWEYPWWVLFAQHDPTGRREIVALQSVLPGIAPADPASVDAIVCTGPRAACTRLVPPGWHVEFRGYVGYALPPTPR
jgi:hypothetical protein